MQFKSTNNNNSFLNFDFRPPLIINKDKISNGECPDVDDDMRDIDIEEEEDDRCGDCPYCDSRVSITTKCSIQGLCWHNFRTLRRAATNPELWSKCSLKSHLSTYIRSIFCMIDISISTVVEF